jgi:hypothetical protein
LQQNNFALFAHHEVLYPSQHLIIYLTYFHNATHKPYSLQVHNVMQAQQIDHLFDCFQILPAIVAKI